jgi:hypothetical protein
MGPLLFGLRFVLPLYRGRRGCGYPWHSVCHPGPCARDPSVRKRRRGIRCAILCHTATSVRAPREAGPTPLPGGGTPSGPPAFWVRRPMASPLLSSRDLPALGKGQCLSIVIPGLVPGTHSSANSPARGHSTVDTIPTNAQQPDAPRTLRVCSASTPSHGQLARVTGGGRCPATDGVDWRQPSGALPSIIATRSHSSGPLHQGLAPRLAASARLTPRGGSEARSKLMVGSASGLSSITPRAHV